MDLTVGVHQILDNYQKSAMETLIIIRQAFGEESMSSTWMFEWKSPNSLRPKKGGTDEEQSQKQKQTLWLLVCKQIIPQAVKLMPTFADRVCCTVSAMDLYGR
jgi:hypothetical protein